MGTAAAQSLPSPVPHLLWDPRARELQNPEEAVPRSPVLELPWVLSLHLVPVIDTQRRGRWLEVAQLGHDASPPPLAGSPSPTPAPRPREARL